MEFRRYKVILTNEMFVVSAQDDIKAKMLVQACRSVTSPDIISITEITDKEYKKILRPKP